MKYNLGVCLIVVLFATTVKSQLGDMLQIPDLNVLKILGRSRSAERYDDSDYLSSSVEDSSPAPDDLRGRAYEESDDEYVAESYYSRPTSEHEYASQYQNPHSKTLTEHNWAKNIIRQLNNAQRLELATHALVSWYKSSYPNRAESLCSKRYPTYAAYSTASAPMTVDRVKVMEYKTQGNLVPEVEALSTYPSYPSRYRRWSGRGPFLPVNPYRFF